MISTMNLTSSYSYTPCIDIYSGNAEVIRVAPTAKELHYASHSPSQDEQLHAIRALLHATVKPSLPEGTESSNPEGHFYYIAGRYVSVKISVTTGWPISYIVLTVRRSEGKLNYTRKVAVKNGLMSADALTDVVKDVAGQIVERLQSCILMEQHRKAQEEAGVVRRRQSLEALPENLRAKFAADGLVNHIRLNEEGYFLYAQYGQTVIKPELVPEFLSLLKRNAAN